jgi:hypothetical protein
MFESEADTPRFSVGPLILQLFAVPSATLILGFIITLLIEGADAKPALETLSGYFAFSVEGFALGYAVQRAFPRAIACGGPWVWIAPASLLVLGRISDTAKSHASEIPLYFRLTSEGETGWGFMLLTLPAIACCFYSIGVVAAHRRTRRAARVPQPTALKH